MYDCLKQIYITKFGDKPYNLSTSMPCMTSKFTVTNIIDITKNKVLIKKS